MDNLEIRARKDRDCHGGGLLEFFRKAFDCKRQTPLEPNNLECMCSVLTISNIKWVCFSIYRPPNSPIIRANDTHENFIFMGDFNIDIGISNSDHDRLEQFCSLFNLQFLIKKETCVTKTHKSTIDLILANT